VAGQQGAYLSRESVNESSCPYSRVRQLQLSVHVLTILWSRLSVHQVQPLAALRSLLPLLAPSAAFVVYARSVQPLAEAMRELRKSKDAVGMQLQVCGCLSARVMPRDSGFWL
jgi:hypothetical protein